MPPLRACAGIACLCPHRGSVPASRVSVDLAALRRYRGPQSLSRFGASTAPAYPTAPQLFHVKHCRAYRSRLTQRSVMR